MNDHTNHEDGEAPVSGNDLDLKAPDAYINRELSWLTFARRVLSLVENETLPLAERLKFAGIMGMLHDEFFMKRMSGLKRQARRMSAKLSLDGRHPAEEMEACRREVVEQIALLSDVLGKSLRPALEAAKLPILDYDKLEKGQKKALRDHFRESVAPILTPLAVDSEHPFPFISNFGINLAVVLREKGGKRERFLRIKVPDNRPRWVPIPKGSGWVPLEQVIGANLDILFGSHPDREMHLFRVTRGVDGERADEALPDPSRNEPGSIIQLVSSELKARRFAGVVRLQVQRTMPDTLVAWLVDQLGITADDVYPTDDLLGIADLARLDVGERDDLKLEPHTPVDHPRFRALKLQPGAIFKELRKGDVLLHHPYNSFDSSVLRFLESAAVDPKVLAIKLTIYRTSSDSPIVKALAEAARRGKQVAVLVEVTARFDEAPNIAWGSFLEQEGVHVAYGVERLKTHVKLALVVREEGGELRRYAHVGTGNYHSGTARIYEDLGVLTSHEAICEDVAAVFNELTGSTPYDAYQKLLVAPRFMRRAFASLLQREAEHAAAGRPSGVYAKMNQLQDPQLIRELYKASRAGVPITLNVRGLCCLRPGVAGLSESIRLYSVVGRFLEHSRIYRFENGGEPEYFLGSADWMKRNLSNRVETIMPVLDVGVQSELESIIGVYEADNCSAWDGLPDGSYRRREPAAGEPARAAQEVFIRLAQQS